jgi:hypothetical protein
MNYHKFGIHSFLFFSSILWAFFMFFANPGWAAGLPDPSSYWRLDEGSQPYRDFSSSNDGSCTDGELNFCPERVLGIIDQAQLFDGVSEGLDIPGNSFNWISTDSFTVAFWMKRQGPPPLTGQLYNEVIVGREDRELERLHWWVGVHNKDGGAGFFLIDSGGKGDDDSFFLLSDKTIADGEWHHVVAVRDAGQNLNNLYVDGVLEDSVTITYSNDFASSFAELNIGYLLTDFGKAYYYEGIVDDVRIYNAALSETEIGDLYRLRPRRIMPWVPSILLNDE